MKFKTQIATTYENESENIDKKDAEDMALNNLEADIEQYNKGLLGLTDIFGLYTEEIKEE